VGEGQEGRGDCTSAFWRSRLKQALRLADASDCQT